MIYLKYFENASVIGNGVEVELPDVSYLHNKNVLFIPGSEGTATVKVNSTTGEIEVETEPDYSSMYLTFEAMESGTFSVTKNGTMSTPSYSLDGGNTWTEYSSAINVNTGDKVLWKNDRTSDTFTSASTPYIRFSETGNFKAYGNVMSLIYGDNFIGQTDLTGKDYAFSRLFSNNTRMKEGNNLILPATTLARNCYYEMFYNCSYLPVAPALPATTLASQCYYEMFYGCTSLTTAPALPATTLTSQCYSYMFQACRYLITAPILPATTLQASCYSYMFQGCISLTTAPTLPATTLAVGCYNSMFDSCISLTTAPELPATALTSGCYYEMFNNCPNLNYIKMMATDISANSCLNNWVLGVAATGTFVKAAGVTIPSGTSGIPSGWTVESI